MKKIRTLYKRGESTFIYDFIDKTHHLQYKIKATEFINLSTLLPPTSPHFSVLSSSFISFVASCMSSCYTAISHDQFNKCFKA